MIDKIINLLEFRNSIHSIIDEMCCDDGTNKKIRMLSNIDDQFSNLNQISEIKSALNKLDSIQKQNKDVLDQVKNLFNLINDDLDLIGNEIMSDESKFYYTSEFIHDQIKLYNSVDLVKTRIGGYANWQYPGICIHPKNKMHIDWLVASDPLYMLHLDFEILENLISQYDKIYQRRLRLYHFNENDFFSMPNEFAGVVLCWDSFNFLNIKLIKELLEKSYRWLRPGGTFIANYNNCDLVETAQSLKFGCFAYCNPRILKKLADSIGFTVEFFDIKNETTPLTYTSWAEFHKPGALLSMRAHQPLAEIIKII